MPVDGVLKVAFRFLVPGAQQKEIQIFVEQTIEDGNEEVESFLIKKTLARCDGNARKAAEELGLSRSAFYRRLERYKL